MPVRDSLRWYLVGGIAIFLLFLLVWLISLLWRSGSSSVQPKVTGTPPMRISTTPLLRRLTEGPYLSPVRIPESMVPTSPPTPIFGPGKQIVSGIAVNTFPATITPINPQGDRILAETSTYRIAYLQQFQEFKIALTGQNFALSRREAEQEFLRIMGVNEPNACRLSVIEYVPNYVKNPQQGLEYPMSICDHDEGEP